MRILIADDDPVTLNLLSTKLESWEHTVLQAADGAQAWEIFQASSVDIVITDWIMPHVDGLELCRRIREHDDTRYVYLILISAQDSKEEIVQGLESGVDDYITKPIDIKALQARIQIGERIVRLEQRLTSKIELITANHYQTIRMFSQLVEAFDEDLGGHCRRTAKLAVELAGRCPRTDPAEIPVIETAALLHDIGMVGIPKQILNKRRTEMINDERRLYQSHAVTGASIVGEIEIMKPAARLVGMHHEQINGKGFPNGLAGDDIPLGAQLISAASIYDNLLHKGKVARKDVPEQLQRLRGYQLSGQMVQLLLEINLACQHEEALKTEEERRVDELQPGMVLAFNVHMNTGAFVMAGDTELSAYHIEKLNHYHAIGAISDRVLIRKPSARS